MEALEGHVYHYNCERWYGKVKGIANILTKKGTSEDTIQDLIIQDAKTITGSQTCESDLLQKYEILIKPIKTYPSITSVAMNLNLGKD